MKQTNEMNIANDGLLPFDPIVLVMDVAKRWLLIVLAALMVGFGFYIYKDATYQPVYTTTTTFVVTARGSSTTVYNNLSSTTNLASVFEELLNSSILRKEILKNVDGGSFDGTIQASVVSDTNLLTMKVSASDARTAFQVTEAIIEHHGTLTYNIVGGVILEVLQSPTVPMAPSNSNNAFDSMQKIMVLAAAATAGLLGLQSFSRDVIRSAGEAQKRLNCSYLGELPHEKKRKTLLAMIRRTKSSILITNPTTSFGFVENVRKLRRRVEKHMHHGKVLMVTSLLENEGKSTVAVNMALSLSQRHDKVLLIDCDLRKPACYAVLEQRNFAHGLVDILTGKANVHAAIFNDKKSGLDLLLEKNPYGQSADMISSAAMRAILEWARKEYDYIVLDMPPMAAASDAESMKEIADASLLVVRQNVAAAPALNKAIASLEGGRAKMLGCVLNNVYSTVLSSGRGFGYGGYGRYNRYGRYGRYGAYDSKKSH